MSDLPHGCITPEILRTLATVMEKLHKWHQEMRGSPIDTPCLRRIESDGDNIVATVHVGPPVGGKKEKFILHPSGWWEFANR
jgi:hypothetical protein